MLKPLAFAISGPIAALAAFWVGSTDHNSIDARNVMVASERAASLNPGINIWRWFRRPTRETDLHYANYVTLDELNKLHEWGFRSVRLPIGEPFLFDNGILDEHPSQKSLRQLRAAINRITQAGMVVVVDYHPGANEKKKLESQAKEQDVLVNMWANIANSLADTSPDKVIFEPYNEPHFKKFPNSWNSLAERLHDAIRSNAPNHTIVIDTSMAADPGRLAFQKILPDGNVIYSVHFYEPRIFVSQGAQPGIPGLAGLKWPADRQNCAHTVKTLPNYFGKIQVYCSRFDQINQMNTSLKQLSEWKSRNNRALWVGEFGVSARGTDPVSREHWFREASKAFSRYNLPATLWSYDDCWGLALKASCSTVLPANDDKRDRETPRGCSVLAWLGRNNFGCADLENKLRVSR